VNNPNEPAFAASGNYGQNQVGLTKRELLASLAMQGLVSVNGGWIGETNADAIAERAVVYADALIAALYRGDQ
jgi:hypothetical protein